MRWGGWDGDEFVAPRSFDIYKCNASYSINGRNTLCSSTVLLTAANCIAIIILVIGSECGTILIGL